MGAGRRAAHSTSGVSPSVREDEQGIVGYQASGAFRFAYDWDNQRLQVYEGETCKEFADVPPDALRGLLRADRDLAGYVDQHLRGQYASEPIDAATASWHGAHVRRRCPFCGQYVGDHHVCPIGAAPEVTYIGEGAALTMRDAAIVRARLLAEPGNQAHFDAQADINGERVGAWVHAYGQGDRISVEAAGAHCECNRDDCAARRLFTAEIHDRLNSVDARTPERHATRAVLSELADDRAVATTAQRQLQAAWPTRPEVSYTNDIEAFQHDYEQARDRHSRGEPAVPYLTDNATGGLGARDGGRGFGAEIEFDFPSNVNRGEAINGIARDLHAAGLSRHTVQAGYHAAHREGYTDAPNGWRLESDCTVAGEIVSPIMYDEPVTWHNLEQVCDIVRRHGGRASYNTGGHIHVSTHDYDHTVENHNRLLQLATGYQDTLYRLAQNPEAPRHRGRSYCYPNRDPGNGYTSVGSVRTNNAGHGPAVNFGSVRGATNDHVEMRLWDGSLSPAVIQTQIKLSLGMTAAASRGGFTPPAREPVGSHREHNRGQHTDGRLHDQAWIDNTASFRTLIDTIYTRAADKAQATALFALTRWQQR